MDDSVAEGGRAGQRISVALRRMWLASIDWLVPPKCLLCKTGVERSAALCLSCWQGLHFIDEPVCEALGTPFAHDEGEGALSPAAIADPPHWDRGRAAVAFGESARQLVHLLKYRDTPEAGHAMANVMAGAGRRLLAECDLIIPVPLHRRRLWRRRFNQAGVLALHLAERSRKPFAHDVLLRRQATPPQVGLRAGERLKNVRQAFVVPPDRQAVIDGKAVLLVDDVRTTGATLAACARTLKKAGAARVDVLTFALVLEPARLHIDA